MHAQQSVSDAEPSTAERLNRLFATFHSRAEPEQSETSVAAAVSAILGEPVADDVIVGLRAGTRGADPELLTALARHFGVRPEYLTGSGASVTVLHQKLELLAHARDAGLRRLALRGGTADDADLLDKVLGILDRLDAPGPVGLDS